MNICVSNETYCKLTIYQLKSEKATKFLCYSKYLIECMMGRTLTYFYNNLKYFVQN